MNKYLIKINSKEKETIEQAFNLAIGFANFEQYVDILILNHDALNFKILASFKEFDISEVLVEKKTNKNYLLNPKVIDKSIDYKHTFEFKDE